MSVKIRLMRIGATKRPFYRVVAVDERKKRTGGFLDLLGTYNPLTDPKEIKLDQAKIDEWVKKGAQMSDGFLRIIGKAPQRPPRKPKKEKKEEPAAPAEAAAQDEKIDPQVEPEDDKKEQEDKVGSKDSSQPDSQNDDTQEGQEMTPTEQQAEEAPKQEEPATEEIPAQEESPETPTEQ